MKSYKLILLFVLAVFGASLAACASTETKRGTGAYLDDKSISARVKTDLAADPVTKASDISVETYNGTVQLSGFVTTQDSIRRAEEIARGVSGVRAVQNNLVLRSTVPPGPAAPAP